MANEDDGPLDIPKGQLQPWTATDIEEAARIQPGDPDRALRRVRPTVAAMLTATEEEGNTNNG